MTYWYIEGWITNESDPRRGVFCLSPMADIFTSIPSYLVSNGEHAVGMDGLEFA